MHWYVISSRCPHEFIQFLQPVKKLKIEKQKQKNNPVADEMQVCLSPSGAYSRALTTRQFSATQRLPCCVLSKRVCDSHPPLRCFYTAAFQDSPDIQQPHHLAFSLLKTERGALPWRTTPTLDSLFHIAATPILFLMPLFLANLLRF